MRAIETRQKQIADGLAAGEQGRQELASAEKRDRGPDDRSEGARLAEIVANGEKFRPRRSSRRRPRRRPRPSASSPPPRPRSRRKWRARRSSCATRSRTSRSPARRRSCSARSTRRRTPTCSRTIAARALERTAMAERTTIARPYAEAAFEIAREQQRAAALVRDAAARRARSSPTRRWRLRSTTRSSTPATKESLFLSVCRRPARRRRAQLRPRADRGRPHRAAAGDPRAVRVAARTKPRVSRRRRSRPRCR